MSHWMHTAKLCWPLLPCSHTVPYRAQTLSLNSQAGQVHAARRYRFLYRGLITCLNATEIGLHRHTQPLLSTIQGQHHQQCQQRHPQSRLGMPYSVRPGSLPLLTSQPSSTQCRLPWAREPMRTHMVAAQRVLHLLPQHQQHRSLSWALLVDMACCLRVGAQRRVGAVHPSDMPLVQAEGGAGGQGEAGAEVTVRQGKMCLEVQMHTLQLLQA